MALSMRSLPILVVKGIACSVSAFKLSVTCNFLMQEPLDESSKGIPDPLHHPVPELESPASSKDADQPSPISTLEAPFTDDISSGSECFESLSADLHGK